MNDRQLSTNVREATTRELASLVETGLMNPEEQRAISVAAEGLALMKGNSAPMGERHFNAIDRKLSMRAPTPVSEAREVLTDMDAVWGDVRSDFHKYRKMFFEAKLRRAKVAQAKKRAASADPDDRELAEAAAALEQANIDELEANVGDGYRSIQDAIAKAKKCSERYAVICQQAGKEAFTDEDFKRDEIDYLIKSAWWVASQVLAIREFSIGRTQHTTMIVPEEIIGYFKGLGVDEASLRKEVGDLAGMRAAFDINNSGWFPQSFKDHFNSWLDRMVEKYRPFAEATIAANGFEKVRRIAKMLPESPEERGKKVRGTEIDRSSLVE
jgi:hypothetical protein